MEIFKTVRRSICSQLKCAHVNNLVQNGSSFHLSWMYCMIISHSSIMGPEFSIKLSSSLIITCWRFKSRFQLVGMFDDNIKTFNFNLLKN